MGKQVFLSDLIYIQAAEVPEGELRWGRRWNSGPESHRGSDDDDGLYILERMVGKRGE